MRKRYIFFGSLISVFLLFVSKIIHDLIKFRSDENVLWAIKSRDIFFENWPIYLGSLLMLISIIGILMILFNPCDKESDIKNSKFENLYSVKNRR